LCCLFFRIIILLTLCAHTHIYFVRSQFQFFKLFSESSFQSFVSRRFCLDSKSEKLGPLHPSGQSDIPSGRSIVQASSIQTTRTFLPNLPLCREPLNCSGLYSSKLLSNTFGRLSMFNKLKDFFPKYIYGKIAELIRTMCVPIRTQSLIRQVVQKKFNRPNVRLHGPDAQALYMKIACISSTVRASYFMVRTLKALMWKLRAAQVQPS
jgi:hypothetical protein